MSIELIMQNLPEQVSPEQANQDVLNMRESSLAVITFAHDVFLRGVEVNFTDEGVIALSEESLNFIATRTGQEPSEESRAEILTTAQLMHAVYCEKTDQVPIMPG
ncbi:hypothetical protein COB21_02095 [Candidatus Aerophobetes bacterium]|uniref:Uncharacterized protein n=1 Tax=Aerophobetes bacterium TaxID=2030807 RepID=A0A2A4X5U9_UNCAE|nr:MAG: hypothetical protein COB21_02095 [Candidatus Aerophobetes bacterium]